MRTLVEGSRPTLLVPTSTLTDLRRQCAGVVTVEELRRRVYDRLIENGADETLARLVISEGFFTREDGLENLARAMKILDASDVVVEEVDGRGGE
jgi:hypothetical protein